MALTTFYVTAATKTLVVSPSQLALQALSRRFNCCTPTSIFCRGLGRLRPGERTTIVDDVDPERHLIVQSSWRYARLAELAAPDLTFHVGITESTLVDEWSDVMRAVYCALILEKRGKTTRQHQLWAHS